MRELLNRDPSIDGVFANSDALALGAVDAIEEAGLADEIVVTGFDGLPDALLEVTRGTIAATVRQMPEAMGRVAIDVALRIHAREEVPPVVQVDFGLVTKSNVAQASVELLPIFPRILRDLIQGDGALADERALLRTLIDNLPDLIYVKDADSRFLLVNEAAAAHLGAPTSDYAIGRTDLDFFPDEYATKYRADEERLLESGRPLINHEELARAATGDLRWLSTTKVATRNESGLITGLVGMSRDITESRATQAERARLIEEHEALRRLATLVMASAPSERIFAAVAEEAAGLLGGPLIEVIRYGADETFTVVGASGDDPFPVGSRWALDCPSVAASILESREPARVDDYSRLPGRVAEAAYEGGYRSAIGAPIIVAGAVWGAIIVITMTPTPIADGTETQLGLFTDLIATAIANAQSQEALAKLVEEQAALRRVAILIARATDLSLIFSAVSEEAARLFGSAAGVLSFEGDRGVVFVGVSNIEIPVGTRWPLAGGMTTTEVYRTGRPARVEHADWSDIPGPAGEASRRLGTRSIVGCPIVVGDHLWGALVVSSTENVLPPDTEQRVGKFTDLIATAIATAEVRQARAQLADEQAALHRLAMLVAEGVPAQDIFDAVCLETSQLLGACAVNLSYYTSDRFNLTMASTHLPVGTRVPIVPDTVFRTGAPARVDDWNKQPGQLADLLRDLGVRSSLAVPIFVEGRLWGALAAGTDEDEPLPAGTEARLGRFAELLATAISNAATRTELIESRARIVAAGDEARHRVERNLHDGTQQRLIALGLDIQRVRAAIPEDGLEARLGLERVEEDLDLALEDLRQLSRGLHPPLLARRGLSSALRALGRDSPIPVELEVDLPERPSTAVETAVYYVVSEAVTNAIRHSNASVISVTIEADHGGEPFGIGLDGRRLGVHLHATITDDGVGGADPSVGSGLTGLADRIDALGGRFVLETPSGGGTRISVELPLESR
jgi:PAS domain S-box-containing protein